MLPVFPRGVQMPVDPRNARFRLPLPRLPRPYIQPRLPRFRSRQAQRLGFESLGWRSEEHTSELQSHRDLHSFPTRTLFRSVPTSTAEAPATIYSAASAALSIPPSPTIGI